MKKNRFAAISAAVVLVYAGVLLYAYIQGYWPAEGDDEYVFEFSAPVLYGDELVVRNDAMGAGHFGAPRGGGTRSHAGVDLYAPMGYGVMAAEKGVVETGNSPGGYGLLVRINHGNGYVTLYAHLLKIKVEDGQFVKKGEKIGTIGKTGNAGHELIEPHLHFEIIKEGTPVDPMDYLPVNRESSNTSIFNTVKTAPVAELVYAAG